MSEFPSYRPIQQFVIDNLNLKRKQIYTSRLNAWIRVTGNAGGGLVLQSNPNAPLLGENGVYGNKDAPGIVGFNWNEQPVRVTGEDRGLRPSPIIEGLTVKNGTMGLTRECNFTIKAYTPGQVDVLQLYFGQPGFTALVEFGWDLERSHNQKVSLNASSIASLNNFGNVLKKRKNSEGDYANFFGFITGFKVGSSGDTYELDITLKGLGELPQTLKIHKHIEDDTEGSEKTEAQTSLTYSPKDIIDEEDVGRKNFKYMFNALPGHKQIASVKKLINELGKEENFINFNEKTKQSISDETEGMDIGKNKISIDGERVAIPKGTKLIGDERFIRFGTFKKIIDTNDIIDTNKANSVGGNPLPIKVYTDETICNAFDRIFSTAKDRLVIPNPNTPDFGFLKALKGEAASFQTGNNDCSQLTASGGKVQFPKQEALNQPSSNGFLGLVRSSGTYGFLDDLYINFDFAVSVIEAENLSYGDAILELCNGMSAAVNSIWEFQIIEKACSSAIATKHGLKEGTNILQVVEMNCTTEEKLSSRKLVHNGEGSFFLNGTLDIDLPGEMANSIIADRKKLDGGGSVDLSPEGADAGGFPINSEEIRDSVLETLNSDARVKKEDKEKKTGTNKIATQKEIKDEEDVIAAIYNAFLEKVGCYPKRKDGEFNLDDNILGKIENIFVRNNQVVSAEEVLIYPTYDDQGLFKRLMSEDNPNLKSGGSKTPKGAGVLIGMLKYNFEVHGNSGISHGDTFNVIGIPSVYRKTGFFQLTNVEHTVNQMNWTTAIEGTYRAGETDEV